MSKVFRFLSSKTTWKVISTLAGIALAIITLYRTLHAEKVDLLVTGGLFALAMALIAYNGGPLKLPTDKQN